MIKILFVEGCKDGTVGGSHTSLLSLAAHLDRERFHPAVVFYDDHGVAAELRALGIETHILRKPVLLNFQALAHGVSPSLTRAGAALLPLQKALNGVFVVLRTAVGYARFLRKAGVDIVHLNNSVNTNHEWILAAKLVGARVVSHERGINEHVARTAKVLGKALDRMICASEAIRQSLAKQGFNRDNMLVVYDGIDPSRLQAGRSLQQVRSAYGLTDADPVVGVVGTIKRWKGQETVVRATALLKKRWPGVKCLLVGGTVEGDTYKSELERAIDELGIRGSVIFAGFQHNPPDLVQVMDVVVHSSIEPEPFGMVNLEAMYLGKPVIATDLGGPREIFEDGKDGFLVEAGNPAVLAQAVSTLLGDPGLRERIGRSARASVLRKFRLADTVRQVEQAYDEVLGTSRRPAS